jgi:hypothetical protein
MYNVRRFNPLVLRAACLCASVLQDASRKLLMKKSTCAARDTAHDAAQEDWQDQIHC